jgi:valyl-tRNA synthetase
VTHAFENYNYARALELAESFFWTFTDDYVELVKERAYGGQGEQAAASAKAALSLALSVQLRLFAPFLPFTTEEVWSWVHDSSIHRASWPKVEEFSALPEGDPGVLEATGQALSGVRKVKSEQKVSMRARVLSATISGPGADIERISQAMEDLAAAGSIEGMNVTDGSETLQVEAELAPVE